MKKLGYIQLAQSKQNELLYSNQNSINKFKKWYFKLNRLEQNTTGIKYYATSSHQ